MDRTIHCTSHCTSPRRRPGLLAAWSRMLEIRRQQRRLTELNDHLLDDIGLTREQADAEAKAPVWDVPASWRR